MQKKYLKIIIPASSVIFAIVIFLILFFNIPRLSYKYNAEYDGYFVVEAYGNAKTYEVKSTHKGKPVVGIDTRAFYKHDKLEEINLPDSISVIERLAFSECKNLKFINLKNVDLIYRNAFSYCKKLDDITIAAEHIGASAFYKCDSLEIVKLENDILSIGSMAFAETKIKSISIPRSVEVIESDCFYNCLVLKNINVYGNKLKDNKYLKELNIVTYIG